MSQPQVATVEGWCDDCETEVEVEVDLFDVPPDGEVMVEFVCELCGRQGVTFENFNDPIGEEERAWERATGR